MEVLISGHVVSRTFRGKPYRDVGQGCRTLRGLVIPGHLLDPGREGKWFLRGGDSIPVTR